MGDDEPAAFQALHISSEAELAPGGRLERDASGKLTGGVSGPLRVITSLFDRLPKPTLAEQVEGTRKFFRELNRLALIGVVDPQGNNMTPGDYAALFQVWRQGQMTVRVAFSLGAQTPGRELEEFQNQTRLLPMGFGDDMLHFNGIGESVTAAMYNNDKPTPADKEKYYEVAEWAAEQGMTWTQHWGQDASAGELLSIFERVNRDIPIAPLHWSIAHLNDASPKTLRRMKALGVGWTVQDAMYFGGDQFLQQNGAAATRRVPPVETAKEIGVAVGAGTDAHRVASYNPFTACNGSWTARQLAAQLCAAPKRRPAARTPCASTRWAAPGSRATWPSGARSNPASWPTSRFSRPIT